MSVRDVWAYWAKSAHEGTYHALPAHLLDVAAVGSALLEKNPQLKAAWAQGLALSPAALNDTLRWWLAMHDVGKFSDRFQGLHEGLYRQLHPHRNRRAGTPHHTTLGSVLVRHHLRSQLADRMGTTLEWDRMDAGDVVRALEPPFTGHHGQPPELLDTWHGVWDSRDVDAARAWVRELDALFPQSCSWAPGTDPQDIAARIRAASWHLAGFVILCDWIGSNTSWFPPNATPTPTPEYWQQIALPRARDAVEQSGVLPAAVAPLSDMRGMFSRAPGPMQALLEKWKPSEGPNLLIVEDTTGSGKTEASLLAIHRVMASGAAGGFYFALPTQATANAVHARMKRAAAALFAEPGRASLVLAHAGRLAMGAFRDAAWSQRSPGRDEGGLECAAWLADSRKKAFLAHAGVGTLDQALLGVLAVRHQSLRIFGLGMRVLVVDEVHAYDAYSNRLLKELVRLQALAGGTVILLSATMPRALRQDLATTFAEAAGYDAPLLKSDAYPLLTLVDTTGLCERDVAPREGCARRIRVALLHETDSVLQQIREASARGAAVCWIRNTVDEARAAWQALRDDGAVLVHSRFTEADRRSREDALMHWAGPNGTPAERRGRIVVATQVIEQSLDVDFDLLVTDLAPIELVLQRMGRLHRHPGRERPAGNDAVLVVHAPDWAEDPPIEWARAWSRGTVAVYPDEGRLWLSQQALRAGSTIAIPEDARRLIEHVYGEDSGLRIAPALAKASRDAEGKDLANRSHAHAHLISLHEGYAPRSQAWSDPDRGRTRAGEDSVDIYLASEDDANLRPLAPPADGWEGSRVRIPLSLARRMGVLDAKTENEPAPGVRRIVTLVADERGGWSGRVGQARMLYDEGEGFRLDMEESA